MADRARESYASAEPFPHAVFDGLFPEDVLDEIRGQFPPVDSPVWKEYENYHEVKQETQGEEHVSEAISQALYQFNSAPFLQFLERLTGIDNLLPDPYFLGGGLHQIPTGGKLGIHADFSQHGRLPLHRRVNALLYLNRDWREEWGGALELWDRDRVACRRRIFPNFNRLAVFTITDWSFHGHPDPMTCPPDVTRKSIALYYFTVDRPPGETMPGKISTLFVPRPGEEVPEGTLFSRDGWTGPKSPPPPPAPPLPAWRRGARRVAKDLTPPIVVRGVRRLLK